MVEGAIRRVGVVWLRWAMREVSVVCCSAVVMWGNGVGGVRGQAAASVCRASYREEALVWV